MKQEEFNQGNRLFNNIESLPISFVNQQEEEELNSEDKTLNLLCVKLPEKDGYLRKKNYLGEFFLEEDKAKARSNLGITPLLEELKALIFAKLIDEAGNIKYDSKPTSGREDSEAYIKVLSSDTIFNALLLYYTKEESDNQIEYILGLINKLRSEKTDKQGTYTKEEIINFLSLKQNPIEDLEKIRNDSFLGLLAYLTLQKGIPELSLDLEIQELLNKAGTAYLKPQTGIPEEDFESNLLEKINSAYHLSENGIPKSDLSESVLESLNKANTALLEHLDISGKADKSEVLKFVILSELEYESLENYDRDIIYVVLENGQEDSEWGFGDGLPIILN